MTERPLSPRTIPAFADEPVVSSTSQGTATWTAELPAEPKNAEKRSRWLFRPVIRCLIS
jgi:hypothetical protein